MHRNIEVTVDPANTAAVVAALNRHPYVMGLSLLPGASVKPAGDLVLVQVLNRGTDDVLSIIQKESGTRPFSITTAEVASMIDPARQKVINKDVDEAIWEEVEAGLRHNGRLTPNFILLMAIGGIITAIGFVSDVQNQVIAFIAASIIAPGLEPLAKLPLGLVLRKRECLLFGLRASVVGYSVILIAAIGTFFLLQQLGEATPQLFLEDDFTKSLCSVKPKDWVLSIAASAASILMYLSYRRNVIAGPLIALILVPAACAIGISLLLGEWEIAGRISRRLGAELLVTIAVGALVIYLKQLMVHKRKPLV